MRTLALFIKAAPPEQLEAFLLGVEKIPDDNDVHVDLSVMAIDTLTGKETSVDAATIKTEKDMEEFAQFAGCTESH